MSDQPNPYAVTACETSEVPAEPIHFGGTLTKEDLLMGLRETPPRRGFSRLRAPFQLMTSVASLLFLAYVFDSGSHPVSPLIWPGLAFVFLQPWFHFVRWVSTPRRRGRQIVQRLAETQKLTRGWMDDADLVLTTSTTFLRTSWSFYSPAYLFADHLVLPLVTDEYRRFVLPRHFFASRFEFDRASQLIEESTGVVFKQPPDKRRLHEPDVSGPNLPWINVSEAKEWSAERWPFPTNLDEAVDWSIDLTAAQRTRSRLRMTMVAIALVLVWYMLPQWVAVLGWLVTEYLFNGSLGFVIVYFWSTLLVLGPAISMLGFFLFFVIRATARVWQIQGEPMRVRMTDSGAHLSHATFSSWWKWSVLASTIQENDATGWSMADTDEEFRLPKACFASQEAFESFKKTIAMRFQSSTEAPN